MELAFAAGFIHVLHYVDRLCSAAGRFKPRVFRIAWRFPAFAKKTPLIRCTAQLTSRKIRLFSDRAQKFAFLASMAMRSRRISSSRFHE